MATYGAATQLRLGGVWGELGAELDGICIRYCELRKCENLKFFPDKRVVKVQKEMATFAMARESEAKAEAEAYTKRAGGRQSQRDDKEDGEGTRKIAAGSSNRRVKGKGGEGVST